MSTETYVMISSASDHAQRFPNNPHGYDGNGLYNKRTGYCMDQAQRLELCAPSVLKDVPEHQHPGGRWVSSRSHQRNENKRHGLVPWEPVTAGRRYSPENKPRLINAKFARRRGLKTNETAQADMHDAMASKRAQLKPPTVGGLAIDKLVFEPAQARGSRK